MTLSIYTGVPGTGKTAHMVDLLQAEIAKGRVIFTNIAGLKLPHYRLGAVQTWQQGTWLHIDRYVRTSPLVGQKIQSIEDLSVEDNDEISDDDGEFNWTPNSDVYLTDTGVLMLRVRNQQREIVGSVEYESHKGALIVIDECQNFFRPRPPGSTVPDHVAAFEVHRKQGLDFWLVTQRLGNIDSNVRGLAGRHVALRSTFLGRYKYEWPEVGDIESKASRDAAARSRYHLPKKVFGLYKSAETHTKQKFSLPFAAKSLLLIVPLVLFLAYKSFSTIDGKFHPEPIRSAQAASNIETKFPDNKIIPASEGGARAAPPLEDVPVPVPIQISACLATSRHCQCYTHNGVHVNMSMAECMEAARMPTSRFRLEFAQQ